MAQDASQPPTRSSRFWLYAPFAILVIVAVAWSAAWFVIRNRAAEALDRGLASEARAGRQWGCDDRRIAGFPFRIEVSCANLTLRRGRLAASFGPVRSVAQVYQPRHVIAHAAGPLRLTDGALTVEGSWRLLETSVRHGPVGLQRASMVVENPQVRVIGAGEQELTVSGDGLEAHLRPTPGRDPAEGAFDMAVAARQARLPVVDLLIGGAEPTDIQLDTTASQVEGFRGRLVAEELERWRAAGGVAEIRRLALAKGARRIEAKGDLRLDALHRPEGQLQVSAAGLDGLLGSLAGGRGAGNLLGALLGQSPAAPAPPGPGAPALSPLPPLRLENGRLLLGPFVVPNLRVPALY